MPNQAAQLLVLDLHGQPRLEYLKSGGENVAVAAGGTTGPTQTQTYSVTTKAAYSTSTSVGVTEVAQAADSLTLSVGVTYTGSSTQTTSVTNTGTQAEGICIGQELFATSGKVIISTPPQGPGSPQDCYKYTLDGAGLSSASASDPAQSGCTNGFSAYSDPNTPGLYVVAPGG